MGGIGVKSVMMIFKTEFSAIEKYNHLLEAANF